MMDKAQGELIKTYYRARNLMFEQGGDEYGVYEWYEILYGYENKLFKNPKEIMHTLSNEDLTNIVIVRPKMFDELGLGDREHLFNYNNKAEIIANHPQFFDQLIKNIDYPNTDMGIKIIREQPQFFDFFAPVFEKNPPDSDELTSLLWNQPQLIDKLYKYHHKEGTSFHNNTIKSLNLASLIANQPELVEWFEDDLMLFNPYWMYKVLLHQPQLIDYFEKTPKKFRFELEYSWDDADLKMYDKVIEKHPELENKLQPKR